MKISKKQRAEAVEYAGILATFWAATDDDCRCDTGDKLFTPEVRHLVCDAEVAADLHEYVDGDDLNHRSAIRSAEAQAMLLEGWSPP